MIDMDLFGMNKVNTKEAIKEMASGVTTGLLESFLWKLEEKDEEIARLKKELSDQDDYRVMYNQLFSAQTILTNAKKTEEANKEEVC